MKTRIVMSLPFQLATAGLVAWILAGLMGATPNIEHSSWFVLLMVLKTTYIGLLKMVVGLVVLFSLLQGISGIGSMVRFRSLGMKTIAFYTLTSVLAIALGLGVSLALPPWPPMPDITSVTLAPGVQLIDGSSAPLASIVTKLVDLATVNPVKALAETNLLAIVTFSVFLGLSLLAAVPSNHPVFSVIEGVNKALNQLVGSIVKFSPVAVFAIVFDFSIAGGNRIWSELATFALVVFVLTAVHGLVVLPGIAKLATGISFKKLFRAIASPMAMAFATSSSSATLPLSLQVAEQNLGISQPTRSMVLPLGAIMNMDGTALFEGVAAIFLAQLYGVDLGTTGLVMIFIMAMVSSLGAPGMPSGSMSGMQLVLLAAGIPFEAIAILLIIERPLDTFRTAVNVEGDLIAALVVDRWTQPTDSRLKPVHYPSVRQ
ncbi:dicarboxylate/amino acid:cation symporter [Parasalinivibrio latis]|uniref:dicarboxylate/amino acid:cation symporter n=1 Tax=Parasalinivibrio latis TaxID=2952610 RepID=UPI0030E41989